MSGYMYIVECNDGAFYKGSTKYLERRIAEHNSDKGANYTSKRQPVKLVYFEEYLSVEDAFLREKQVQKWSLKKKIALIQGKVEDLHPLARCLNKTSSKRIYEFEHLKGNP